MMQILDRIYPFTFRQSRRRKKNVENLLYELNFHSDTLRLNKRFECHPKKEQTSSIPFP